MRAQLWDSEVPEKISDTFSGLALGSHDFEFDIDRPFFDCYEYSIVKEGNLRAQVNLYKQENMMVLQFHITGTVLLKCDVCLTDFPAPMDIEERIIVKFTDDELTENTDEIIVLSRRDHELDISGLLYEFINVAVPHYTKCSELDSSRTCDKELLDKLNGQTSHQEQEEVTEQTDPRWEALKHIKYN